MADELGVTRRDVLRFAAASLTLLVSRAGFAAAPSILGVRVWPAKDYTRITLEHDQPIKFSHLLVKDPERLVVDLEGVEFNSVLGSLPSKVIEADPHIKLLRAGRNKPGVVRIVIELKGEVKPQVFTLKPVGEYGHRLVLDLYPVEPPDPLMALLEEKGFDASRGKEAAGERPEISRLVTIALDPGHGGEDPGAIGRGGSQEKNVTLSIARRLKARIDAEQNLRSVLTRDGDFFSPLHQ
ncbi:partial N-acetylmuramoyl-L-alanine amidase, partial [Rhodocyclaceae bacterium]